jgi:hypothetical protein
LRRLRLPTVWSLLKPEVVRERFGLDSAVSHVIADLLTGAVVRAHAFGMVNDTRIAFMGAIVYGLLEQGRGVQVLDTGDLAQRHFDKNESQWRTLMRQPQPVVLTFGREIETRVGLFYFRELLDRSVEYGMPLVMVTDYPIAVHAPRYADLLAIMDAAGFDRRDVALSGAQPPTAVL